VSQAVGKEGLPEIPYRRNIIAIKSKPNGRALINYFIGIC
jgi:hypothetical protein